MRDKGSLFYFNTITGLCRDSILRASPRRETEYWLESRSIVLYTFASASDVSFPLATSEITRILCRLLFTCD